MRYIFTITADNHLDAAGIEEILQRTKLTFTERSEGNGEAPIRRRRGGRGPAYSLDQAIRVWNEAYAPVNRAWVISGSP